MDFGYTVQNFFTNKDFLDGDKIVGKIFHPMQIIFSAIIFGAIIFFAILLKKKYDESKYKKILTVIWICMVVFEILIVAWETFSAKEIAFDVKGGLSLYPCSIILYALPFAIWGKGNVRNAACGYTCTLGMMGALINSFYPANVLSSYSVLSFAGLHTVFYHAALLFCALTMLLTGYHSYGMAKKWYQLFIPCIPSLIISIPANIVNYTCEADYMWFRWETSYLPQIFGNTPKPIITVILYLLYIFVPTLFYLPMFIKHKRKEKEQA